MIVVVVRFEEEGVKEEEKEEKEKEEKEEEQEEKEEKGVREQTGKPGPEKKDPKSINFLANFPLRFFLLLLDR